MSHPRTSLEEPPDPSDALTLDDLVVRFAAHVGLHNTEHHNRGIGGQTAQSVFEGDRTEIHRLDRDKIALILLRRGVFRTVQKEGIELWGRWYQDPCLNKAVGLRVELGWFGSDRSHLAVFEAVARPGTDGLIGWAKLDGTLTQHQIEGLVASRDRQIRTIEDAERAGDALRLATLPARAEPTPLSAAPGRRSRGQRADRSAAQATILRRFGAKPEERTQA